MRAPTIECEKAMVRRGSFELGPIDLKIETGKAVLLGRNGAGKTTLLRSFLALEAVKAGKIRTAGYDVTDKSTYKELMRRLGFAPQSAHLPAHSRVGDVVSYAAWLKDVPRRSRATQVAAALDRLDVGGFAQQRVGRLSGGERQRVSIAMALVHQPDVVLLDEPSAGLDPIQRVALRKAVDQIAEDRAVLWSTHLVEDIARSDSVVALSGGQITFSGTAGDLQPAASLEQAVWNLLSGGSGQ